MHMHACTHARKQASISHQCFRGRAEYQLAIPHTQPSLIYIRLPLRHWNLNSNINDSLANVLAKCMPLLSIWKRRGGGKWLEEGKGEETWWRRRGSKKRVTARGRANLKSGRQLKRKIREEKAKRKRGWEIRKMRLEDRIRKEDWEKEGKRELGEEGKGQEDLQKWREQRRGVEGEK